MQMDKHRRKRRRTNTRPPCRRRNGLSDAPAERLRRRESQRISTACLLVG